MSGICFSLHYQSAASDGPRLSVQSVAYDPLSAIMKFIPQKQARKVKKMSYVVLKLRIQRILFFYMCVFTGVAISHLQQTNTQTMQTCAE